MGEEGRDYLRRFVADTPFAQHIMTSIDEDGYCVLPGIISTGEADAEFDRAWGFVERVSPSIKRSDWNTWWGSPDPWPYSQRDMMQLHQAGWVFSELREKITERVFEKLYATKELHVSKDGFTFQRPTDRELGRTPNDHFDQGTRWMGLQCIQGSVALTDQSDQDGCFQVWPGSHHHREEILSGCRHHKARSSDFIIMDSNEHDMLHQQGIERRRVPVKRGDVILWRSDVAHCGAPPLGKCDTSRLVAYVCCLPAALTPEPVYEQKLRAYERLETSCHYPNREEWFEEAEKHKKICWKPYFNKPPELTLRQKQLYGLVRYSATEQSEPKMEKEKEKASSRRRPTDHTQIAPSPVPGLDMWCAPAVAVREALVELRPHFRSSSDSSSSDMFEVGWSFHTMEKEKAMRIARPLADFPCLQALLADIVDGFCPEDPTLGDETLNIICRRYTKGQKLDKHCDRPQLFDEDVYGCVLLNSSDKSLRFEQRTATGEEIHILDEQPGLCFRQRGPARYDWRHGVEELSHGERISITWRWIQHDSATEGHEIAKINGPRKGKGKGKGKSQGKTDNQAQRREDPMLDGKAVTFSEMCRRHAGEEMSKEQLREHWAKLKVVGCDNGETKGRHEAKGKGKGQEYARSKGEPSNSSTFTRPAPSEPLASKETYNSSYPAPSSQSAEPKRKRWGR